MLLNCIAESFLYLRDKPLREGYGWLCLRIGDVSSPFIHMHTSLYIDRFLPCTSWFLPFLNNWANWKLKMCRLRDNIRDILANRTMTWNALNILFCKENIKNDKNQGVYFLSSIPMQCFIDLVPDAKIELYNFFFKQNGSERMRKLTSNSLKGRTRSLFLFWKFQWLSNSLRLSAWLRLK